MLAFVLLICLILYEVIAIVRARSAREQYPMTRLHSSVNAIEMFPNYYFTVHQQEKINLCNRHDDRIEPMQVFRQGNVINAVAKITNQSCIFVACWDLESISIIEYNQASGYQSYICSFIENRILKIHSDDYDDFFLDIESKTSELFS